MTDSLTVRAYEMALAARHYEGGPTPADYPHGRAAAYREMAVKLARVTPYSAEQVLAWAHRTMLEWGTTKPWALEIIAGIEAASGKQID